ncbi:MAG: GTPase domain-containing protein [Thermodesulfobacteriota bacterium]|nr:GTPase domain-containing protein [Thermodesulfobacteriota bacterium]
MMKMHDLRQDVPAKEDSDAADLVLDRPLSCPGLTSGRQEIERLAKDLPKRLSVYSYKKRMPYFWVVFVGGTGTGKSTLFNAFCEGPLSDTGVERPKTFGPIVYTHKDCPLEEGFPFPSVEMERQEWHHSDAVPAPGTPGHILIKEHDREDRSHLIVVDTPDLDSVAPANRQIAEDLYLLSDAVVFVSSQEKYADEVPYQFLLRIIREKKPYFFLLNKAQDRFAEKEVLAALQGHEIALNKDRLWLIPYAPSHTHESVSEDSAFQDFDRALVQDLSTREREGFRYRELSGRAEDITGRLNHLLDLLEKEHQAGQKWLNQLEGLYEETCRDLIREQQTRFMAESRRHLQREIRKLFSKYDVMAKPRRMIRETLLSAFSFLGLGKGRRRKTHKDALQAVRQKIDLTPVQAAIDKFNRTVLERLSPADATSALFGKLRDPGVVLSEEEIRKRIWEEQDGLDLWLEQTFQRLSKGIPAHKKLGIYSTSILWGILILSLEIVVGGGFTVVDAVLDSALAPFVTKGAVELFAYGEIQKVARQLANRYQQGLLSVVAHQRDRYRQCLESVMVTQTTVNSLEACLESVGRDLLAFSPSEN